MAMGSREGMQASRRNSSGAESYEHLFQINGGTYLVSRIVFYSVTAPTTSTFTLEAEGERLFSGVQMPIEAVFIPTEQVAAGNVDGPRVLHFAQPVLLRPSYPIKFNVTTAGALDHYVWLDASQVVG